MKRTKRNTLLSVAAIGVSGVLMAASAFAVNNNLSAYTQVKNALLENGLDTYASDAQNMTSTIKIAVEKDGSLMAENETLTKLSKDRMYTMSTILANGQPAFSYESWNEDSRTGHKSISKNTGDETYYVSEFKYPEELQNHYDDADDYHYQMSDADKKFAGALLDTLSGDMKNYFSTDGVTTSLHLEGAQIPELMQLGLASIQSQVAKDNQEHKMLPSADVADSLTREFTSAKDLTFDVIDVQMSNELNAKGYVTASGYDINGAKHSYTIRFEKTSTDIGSTVVDIIDLTDKKVEVETTVPAVPSAPNPSTDEVQPTPSATATDLPAAS